MNGEGEQTEDVPLSRDNIVEAIKQYDKDHFRYPTTITIAKRRLSDLAKWSGRPPLVFPPEVLCGLKLVVVDREIPVTGFVLS
jgi:hypothetical protein